MSEGVVDKPLVPSDEWASSPETEPKAEIQLSLEAMVKGTRESDDREWAQKGKKENSVKIASTMYILVDSPGSTHHPTWVSPVSLTFN
jgi:hypothetical protein